MLNNERIKRPEGFAEGRVKEVLDVVLAFSLEVRGNCGPLVAMDCMLLKDDRLLFLGPLGSSSTIDSDMVVPPE
jgi:hypothetical protein